MERAGSVHRAGRIIRELETLAYSHPARDRIRTVVDGLRTDSAIYDVLLFGHLSSMLEADPGSEVTAELRRMVENPLLPAKLGLAAHAGSEEVREAARELQSRAQGRAMSTPTAAEDAALSTLVHVYGRVGARG